MKRRVIEFDGKQYKLRSNKTLVPNLTEMNRFDALRWLIANTYPKGYSNSPAQSITFGGAISVN